MTQSRSGFRRYHLLGFLPTIGMLSGVLFANRVHPLVLGLPLLFFWIAAWVLATSLIMWVILTLDRAHERASSAGDTATAEGTR